MKVGQKITNQLKVKQTDFVIQNEEGESRVKLYFMTESSDLWHRWRVRDNGLS